jgi:ABC-type multidrug transport system fused ATPase/permease subunit
MDEILKNKKDKIIIFITHRMTTIRKSDIIYCLDNKTILNYGNHLELLKYDNIYSYFWKKQI